MPFMPKERDLIRRERPLILTFLRVPLPLHLHLAEDPRLYRFHGHPQVLGVVANCAGDAARGLFEVLNRALHGPLLAFHNCLRVAAGYLRRRLVQGAHRLSPGLGAPL